MTKPRRRLLLALTSRLCATRERRQLTQGELAERVDVHVNQIQRGEKGQAIPNAESLAAPRQTGSHFAEQV